VLVKYSEYAIKRSNTDSITLFDVHGGLTMKKILIVLLVTVSFVFAIQAMAQEADAPTAFRTGDVLVMPRVGDRWEISVTPVNPRQAHKETKSCSIPTATEVVVVAVRDKDLLLTLVGDLEGGHMCSRCTLFYMPISMFKRITLQERQAEEARKKQDAEVRGLVRESGGTISSDLASPFSDCIF